MSPSKSITTRRHARLAVAADLRENSSANLQQRTLMYFKQFYLGCLAHASYLIGSDGEAAVVDPQRDVDQYIEEAGAQSLKIKYVIETHLHADFVSGHRELAARSGAEIVFGEKAGVTFPHRAVKDGDELSIGEVTLRILETPGHTPESICVLVADARASHEPQKILTGDTLFIGDVGRPDLAGGKGYTPEKMAAMMYDSLHEKLVKLPDDTEVYPAHGAGSMCGKNLSTETSSTIGQQRRLNYALQPMAKADFVAMMTSELPAAPIYFAKDAEINRQGATLLSDLPRLAHLSPEEVSVRASQGEVILDVRSPEDFGSGHISGSLNVGLGGPFASWAGSLISLNEPIVIVADSEAKVAEAQIRLARVGLENVRGYFLSSGETLNDTGLEVAAVPQISVRELKDLIESQHDLQLIDVRRPAEFETGHAPRAVSAPLSRFREALPGLALKSNLPTAIICAGGYRSSAATSIARQMGFTHVMNIIGGTAAWIKAGYEVEGPATGSNN